MEEAALLQAVLRRLRDDGEPARVGLLNALFSIPTPVPAAAPAALQNAAEDQPMDE